MDAYQSEKDKLYQWAYDNYTNTSEMDSEYFTKIDERCTSYFEKRLHQQEYCREYDFQTMPELRNELDTMWTGDDVMRQIEKVVLVACMKNRLKRQQNKQNESKIDEMKPYIYNF